MVQERDQRTGARNFCSTAELIYGFLVNQPPAFPTSANYIGEYLHTMPDPESMQKHPLIVGFGSASLCYIISGDSLQTNSS